MSITNINYPTRKFRPKKSLSSLSWTDISSISSSGDAPYLFTVGDTKDGATLVYTDSSTCIFSLGNVGNACISTSANGGPSDSGMSAKKMGWYINNSYAAGRGITLNSVKSGMSADLLQSIKTVNKSTVVGVKGTSSDYTSSQQLSYDLYLPNKTEWESYATYLPTSGVYWLRDVYDYGSGTHGSQPDYYSHVRFRTYNPSQSYYGYAGYGGYNTSPYTQTGTVIESAVLFFEV